MDSNPQLDSVQVYLIQPFIMIPFNDIQTMTIPSIDQGPYSKALSATLLSLNSKRKKFVFGLEIFTSPKPLQDHFKTLVTVPKLTFLSAITLSTGVVSLLGLSRLEVRWITLVRSPIVLGHLVSILARKKKTQSMFVQILETPLILLDHPNNDLGQLSREEENVLFDCYSLHTAEQTATTEQTNAIISHSIM